MEADVERLTDQTSTRARTHLSDVEGEAHLDFMEGKAIAMLRDVQERYQREAEPIIKHLADIRALRRPSPIYVTAAQFAAFQASLQEAK